MRREVVAQLLRNSILQGPTGGSVQFGRHLEIMHVEIERRPSRDSELYSFYVCNSRVGEKYRSAFSVRLLAMRFAVTRSRLDNIDQAGTSAETVTRPGASLWGGGDCGVYPCEAGVPKGISRYSHLDCQYFSELVSSGVEAVATWFTARCSGA